MDRPIPKLALSVRQPQAYLAGCLQGDACITSGRPNSVRGYIQLRVADWDFAEAFSAALLAGYGVHKDPAADERGYALVRTYNGYGRFDPLLEFVPIGTESIRSWLRGLFDSEGNAKCTRRPKRGPRSWDRRVAVFSTNVGTLETARSYLAALGIIAAIVPWSMSRGHKGTKPVFALRLQGERRNFSAFAELVGSSIRRKADVLDLIPFTYCEPSP